MATSEDNIREGLSSEEIPSVTDVEKQQIAAVLRRARVCTFQDHSL